ncbi:MAG: InlB B-repeat-containing protein, partial [Nitrososphaerota archaeon]|nr:InlB B-repeat-containing protein [Nitrososphaerota archaeon]
MKNRTKFLPIILTAMLIITTLPAAPLVLGQDPQVASIVSQLNTISGLTASVSPANPDIITVTGSVDNAATLNIDIGSGITVKWGALYIGEASPLIRFTGDGTFEVGSGGWIGNDGSGNAINAVGAKVVVTGTSSAESGFVYANSGTAIEGSGPNTTVTVEGFGSVCGDETANIHPVINMNNPANTGDNVFVSGGSVWALASARLGYAIQTYGNVVVSGGNIYSHTEQGRAINLVGYTSIAKISGGKVWADGASGIAISTANTPNIIDSVANASVIVTGGIVSSATGHAIRTTGANSSIIVTGGLVSATTGNAIYTENPSPNVTVIVSGGIVSATTGYAINPTGTVSTITVNGGFVFAYGNTGITGTGNVVRKTSFAPTDTGVVVGWNTNAGSPFVYNEGSNTALYISPAGSATWHNDTVHSGISYTNGANNGFFPISTVTVFIVEPLSTAVTGRTLTTAMTGDTSEWIEIAKNGDYSLILRKNVLSTTSEFQSGTSNTLYNNSLVRPMVNNWFTSTLPANARLRSFTVEHNALTTQAIGNWLDKTGGSTPTDKQNGNGQDVAFLLSFAEAVQFCSTQYASGTGTDYTQSSATAIANFNKLETLGTGQPNSYWWLRTSGNPSTSGQVSTVGYGGINTFDQHGAATSYQGNSNVIHIRPALWVRSSIFATIGVTFNANAPGDSSVVGPTPSSKNVENGATYGTLATVSRTGYNFNGWYTTPSAGSLVTSSTTVTTSANHTLYAHWTPVSVTVTFDANAPGDGIATSG